MKHERGFAALWRIRIRIYQRQMARTLYNLRLLGDTKLRANRLDVFLDGYAASLDVDPLCYSPARRRGADALWNDFVRISHDTNRAFRNHTSKRVSLDE